MTQDAAPSRLPMLIVVAILLVLLAVALLWPDNEPDVVITDTPAISSVAPEQSSVEITAPEVQEVQIIEEEFTAVTLVGEANVEELAPIVEFVEPVIELVEPEPLDLSDQAIKQGLITALRAPLLSTLIVNESIIANLVASITNTAQGTLPENVSLLTPPTQEFAVFKKADNQFISPESFIRYNVYAQTFAQIETADLLALLAQYEPQILANFEQIAEPNADFTDTLITAINRLLDTPSVNLPIPVVSDSAMYKFANPQLEALLPAQKQLLRMGPDNMRMVKAKLRDLRTALASKQQDIK
ncbi:MAG: DUF3014 domain-containing protein [Glaciecola sp.]|nr:DUF3014 domain-containing protein [Glaciecola sp.]MDG1816143.1 DUF3014 domain-containing protein [Glaciecola sp.]MDG2098730.1 DUF3014 domain-containing protein [Glaciecola sp.]